MTQPQQIKSGGIGFLDLLTILFIALKLTGYIVWSWWWVLSPLWLPLAAVVVFALCVIAWAFVAEVMWED